MLAFGVERLENPVSRIPDGLAQALRGIADRLDDALEAGREEAGKVVDSAIVTIVGHGGVRSLDTASFTDVFVAQWMAKSCEQAAREIRATIEAWQKPLPRARRGGRR